MVGRNMAADLGCFGYWISENEQRGLGRTLSRSTGSRITKFMAPTTATNWEGSPSPHNGTCTASLKKVCPYFKFGGTVRPTALPADRLLFSHSQKVQAEFSKPRVNLFEGLCREYASLPYGRYVDK